MIQQIVGKCNRIVNESSPIVDARLENGARVNVVVAPVALNGPILTIRRFPDTPITMEKLIELGSITPECASFWKTGKGPVFNCNWRRNGKWEDHIPGGFVRVHTKR